MSKLFGTDGVRGIANTELTCELAISVGRATVEVMKKRKSERLKLLVGCDTRRSSDMLSYAIMSGICSAGADAYFLGVVPTPSVAFLTQKLNADAGIMISASHNPSEYNGIKIFSSNGYKLPDELEDEIEALISEKALFPSFIGTPIGEKIGKIDTSYINEYKTYLSHLRSAVSNDLSKLKIAIDCSNGSASRTAAELFIQSGASVSILYATPNGININESCGSTHLEQLREFVKENKLDAGFAFDGDADRCLCIDENGNEIDGDMIMAMCALDMKKRGALKNNTIVGTVMTNLGFVNFCKNNDINFISTKVGDRFVLEEMVNGDFSLGGEQSGHIIFRENSTTGDGQLTALKVLELMKKSGKKLSALASVMKRYPQFIINISATSEEKREVSTNPYIKAEIEAAAKKLGNKGRILVRPSGTEALIRVMTEGENEALARSVSNDVAEIIKLFINQEKRTIKKGDGICAE